MAKAIFCGLVLSAFLGAGFAPTVAQSSAPAGLVVTGAGLTATTFTAATLSSAPRLTVTAPDRAGKPHRYEGVPLHHLLTTAGFSLDRHGPALSHVVSVAAADGYRAVLAVGEILPDLAAQVVLVADRCDGQPLPAGAGPWQLIVPADRKPTRWVRQMQRVTVTLVPATQP